MVRQVVDELADRLDPLSALPAAGHESSPNGVISGEKLVFRGTFLRLSRI